MKRNSNDFVCRGGTLIEDLAGTNHPESASSKSQDQLYAILDSLDAIIYVADMESYEILFVNKYAINIFGHITGEICWKSIQADQDGPCTFCTNNKLLDETGEPLGTYVWECQNTINGRFYNLHDRAIRWIDGRMVRLEIAIDITEKKQFEANLIASEEKFHTFADYTYNWEYWIDPDGQFVYTSPSCEQITGYSAEKFSQDPEFILSVIHPDDRELFASHLENELKEDRNFHCDFRIITSTGEQRWIAHSCQMVYGREGEPLGRRASNRNITHRKGIETALAESTAKFKNIFENSPVGIHLVFLGDKTELSGHEKPNMVNSAMLRFFGYSADEFQLKTLEDLSHPEDMKKDVTLLKSLLARTCDSYKLEKRFVHKDGSVLWGNLSRSLIKDEQGRPFYIESVIEDIKERKEVEESLQRSHEKLELKVEERTRELAVANQDLEQEAVRLVETNAALKVLLQHRDHDKEEFENQVVANVKELVEPYLEKLKKCRIDETQRKYIDIIAANLNDIVSPFVHSVSSKYLHLTPTELQVANFVKQGKTTDEISESMNVSPETVSNHRKKIRKKCGITNKKMNLRTMLNSLPE